MQTAHQILKSKTGLQVGFLPDGRIQKIENEQIRLSLKPETLHGDAGSQLYLRKQDADISSIPLTGANSQGRFGFEDNTYFSTGEWEGIAYTLRIEISDKQSVIRWKLDLDNQTSQEVIVDLLFRQDVGLKTIHDGLVNEYYVSQYLERRLLDDAGHGKVLICRQNMKEATGHPWMMLFAEKQAVAGSTDGIQFYGLNYRNDRKAKALSMRILEGEYAGESSVVALQSAPVRLAPGDKTTNSFYLCLMDDHPNATTADDLLRTDALIASFNDGENASKPTIWHKPTQSVFRNEVFQSHDLAIDELNNIFSAERRHTEFYQQEPISFFYGHNRHVVLRKKELLADRPHGHIMQARAGLKADESILSTTCYAFGVFNSHLTQANTNFNVLLSVCTSQFNQNPESGQRIFLEKDGRFIQLAVPSAFEMGLNHCRWIYKDSDYLIEVRTWTSKKRPEVVTEVRFLKGKAVRLLITHGIDPLNGWKWSPTQDDHQFEFTPRSNSMTADKFPVGKYRMVIHKNQHFNVVDSTLLAGNIEQGEHLFGILTEPADHVVMSIVGELKEQLSIFDYSQTETCFEEGVKQANAAIEALLNGLSITSHHDDIQAIVEILPWFGVNALTHFLTPHGLEQFGGAAWGTRDVAQGPFDLLLSMGKYEEARHLLLTIFSNQHADGGWPQWWMFDSYQHIRAHEAHGDIFYWVIMALAQYVQVTGDLDVMHEQLPYFSENIESKEVTSLEEHVGRLVRMIETSFIKGTALVPFGGGDWNDSLQPVNQELAARLISSWTVQMNYQAFRQLSDVYQKMGQLSEANRLDKLTEKIRNDFNNYLVKDQQVAGYGLSEPDGSVRVLLHPDDQMTGIKYSLLPMDRGVLSGIFTAEQAKYHQQVIENQLKGPDGARLMDRPLVYKGGIQELFQRAESSTFFGREIGLMYVHEHIRYAESQAVTGNAAAFVKALRQANPVAYANVVPMADIRQSNCYYSSSDVAFKSRYEADEKYNEVIEGKMTLRGGWRVYSSGPGIYIGLVVQKLLGIRRTYGKLTIDPVMTFEMSGLIARMDLFGKSFEFRYHIENGNYSPKKLALNGLTLNFDLEHNPYRSGGAVLAESYLLNHCKEGVNQMDVWL